VQFCGSDSKVRVYAFDMNGKIEMGWPLVLTQCPCNNRSLTPAIADIDGDKRADMVALSPNGILFAYGISELPPRGDWLQEDHDERNSFTLPPRLEDERLSASRIEPRAHMASGNILPIKEGARLFDAAGRRMGAPYDALPPGLYFAVKGNRAAARLLKVR